MLRLRVVSRGLFPAATVKGGAGTTNNGNYMLLRPLLFYTVYLVFLQNRHFVGRVLEQLCHFVLLMDYTQDYRFACYYI